MNDAFPAGQTFAMPTGKKQVLKGALSSYVAHHDKKSSTISKVMLVVFTIAIFSVVAPKFDATATIVSEYLPSSVVESMTNFSNKF